MISGLPCGHAHGFEQFFAEDAKTRIFEQQAHRHVVAELPLELGAHQRGGNRRAADREEVVVGRHGVAAEDARHDGRDDVVDAPDMRNLDRLDHGLAPVE
ncbi:hypothetical protein EMIT0158MI4_150147 [Burkholderia ambifaria]